MHCVSPHVLLGSSEVYWRWRTAELLYSDWKHDEQRDQKMMKLHWNQTPVHQIIQSNKSLRSRWSLKEEEKGLVIIKSWSLSHQHLKDQTPPAAPEQQRSHRDTSDISRRREDLQILKLHQQKRRCIWLSFTDVIWVSHTLSESVISRRFRNWDARQLLACLQRRPRLTHTAVDPELMLRCEWALRASEHEINAVQTNPHHRITSLTDLQQTAA